MYVWVSGITLSLLLYLWRPLAGVVWKVEGAGYWALTILYLMCLGGMIYTTFFIDYADFLGLRVLLRRMKREPPKPPVFAARGPYAYCRHPLYGFLLLSFWIGPVMTLGRIEFALLGSTYVILGTFLEEKNLREELGPAYDRYKGHVPKWIPRLKPWRGLRAA